MNAQILDSDVNIALKIVPERITIAVRPIMQNHIDCAENYSYPVQ
jgi:hypothetical protein